MQEYESGCFLSEHSACRSRRRLLLGDPSVSDNKSICYRQVSEDAVQN